MTVELFKFGADWCGPCTQQANLLEDTETANEYNVRGLPGLTQPSEIEEAVANL